MVRLRCRGTAAAKWQRLCERRKNVINEYASKAKGVVADCDCWRRLRCRFEEFVKSFKRA